MRTQFLIMVLLGVTACGPLAQQQPVVSVLRGIAEAGSDVWEEKTDPREVLTRDIIEAATNDLLLFAPVNQDMASVFARRSTNSDLIIWVSDEGISLTLQDGVVVATRGLGNDLMGADLNQTYQRVVSGSGSTVRIYDYLNGEDQITRREYACKTTTLRNETIEIFQRKHETRLISETCMGDAGGFGNLYWIDAGGMIWQSRQWISARVGMVDIQRL
ncbi:Group 4 capsule polysaccharide lipoprotein gfcB, YjbF [Yoonia rosea]|uniref:Group 4 capsule polysaccharide lipoprotein gfcB, YjbF n=2 Tax=Yoonia rosea TaxID=287098 RepID=A0A1R3WT96_9RHOB|nr:Group 4 capsule polysaccharide lipoprotein gfcB, YjbF [Yoonia rosea]